jgi:hypothetical protein
MSAYFYFKAGLEIFRKGVGEKPMTLKALNKMVLKRLVVDASFPVFIEDPQ